MLRNRHRFDRGLLPALATLGVLVLAHPAIAGQQGNLEPVGQLLLELDSATSQFRLDDGDGATTDPAQQIFDQKALKSRDACLLGLAPDGSNPTDPDALVSLAASPTDWGIDTGKLALGGRTGKGTGCGQLEFGEITRIQAATRQPIPRRSGRYSGVSWLLITTQALSTVCWVMLQCRLFANSRATKATASRAVSTLPYLPDYAQLCKLPRNPETCTSRFRNRISICQGFGTTTAEQPF